MIPITVFPETSRSILPELMSFALSYIALALWVAVVADIYIILRF
jgi:hypothetical protein